MHEARTHGEVVLGQLIIMEVHARSTETRVDFPPRGLRRADNPV